MGQIEIIDYRGAEGNDLYPRARPPSLGILHVSYAVDDLQELQNLLDRSGVKWTGHGQVTSLLGTAVTIEFQTPAGFRIEAFESTASRQPH